MFLLVGYCWLGVEYACVTLVLPSPVVVPLQSQQQQQQQPLATVVEDATS